MSAQLRDYRKYLEASKQQGLLFGSRMVPAKSRRYSWRVGKRRAKPIIPLGVWQTNA